MTKKLVIVWLVLIMVLFSSISIYADETAQGDFFVKNVVINGEEIINYNLQYPFVLYGNTMYIPLTPEIGEICGFKADMDWESRTLKLLRTDSTRRNISSNLMKNNNVPLYDMLVLRDIKVLAYKEESVSPDTETIDAPSLDIAELDLDGMPVLKAGTFFYLPLRTFAGEVFSWDIYFEPAYGVCVSTDFSVSASSCCNKEELSKNLGLIGYMRRYNPNLSEAAAQNLLFYFRRAADVYGVDVQLLMAISHKESTFNAKATGGGGAAGLMQIMPATGARFGLSNSDLYDPYKNINFGAMYISDRIRDFGGDWVKGLSAYNQGSAPVNRGNYSRTYANRILSAFDSIETYLAENGHQFFEENRARVDLEQHAPEPGNISIFNLINEDTVASTEDAETETNSDEN